ncbi:MAG: hypothetical protein FWH12_07670, partial [Treponema sp.]|nr:hypothetical protein [Treponema sp.]
LLVGTKIDLNDPENGICMETRLSELKAKYPEEEVLAISVFSGDGIKELSYAFLNLTTEGCCPADSLENTEEDL